MKHRKQLKDEIMKTKIRTIIAILALGTIGITNIHATTDNRRIATMDFAIESEQALNIESWMTSPATWNSEETLTVEDWMTDPKIWNAPVVADTTDQEPALQVESWMTDESVWK